MPRPRTKDPLDALKPLTNYENIKAVAYKTVDTFAGICKRKMWLRDEPGGVARTDGHCIKVDLNDVGMYRKVEHEISHILFRSDVVAKVHFVSTYTRRITDFAHDQGVTLRPNDVAQMVDFIINVIEDYRVDSLWGILYPGSYKLMRQMNHDTCLEYTSEARESFLVYFLCITNNVVPPPSRLDVYRPIFEEAMKQVERKGFFSTLLTAKWVVTELVGEIAKRSEADKQGQPSTPSSPSDADEAASAASRAKAMAELLANSVAPEELREQLNDVEVTQYKERGSDARANKITAEVLCAKVGDEQQMQALAIASQKEMEEILNEALKAVRVSVPKDDWIKKDSMAKVVFHDIGTADAKKKAEPLSSTDQDTIRRLRSTFYRVMGKRRWSLDDSGLEVDIPAYIERVASKRNVPCFRLEELGRGFKSLLLIDRSGSMTGFKTVRAERACRIIAKALNYPFVDLNIWGFQSLDHGQVDVSRFNPKMETFSTPRSKVDGNTPLHTAMKLAVRYLDRGDEMKQLIVITDGEPFFTNKGGIRLPSAQLRIWVRDEVRWARNHGINVACLMIGKDANTAHMQEMFGTPRNWKVISEERLGNDMVDLVTSSFVRYLRNR